MASRWEEFADELNDIFGDAQSRKKFSDKFKELHGADGKGYRFGTHASHEDVKNKQDKKLMKDGHKGQFLIDSGRAHWDSAALTNIEDAIRDHAINNKKLSFKVLMSDDPDVILATGSYNGSDEITIICPRTSGRTPRG